MSDYYFLTDTQAVPAVAGESSVPEAPLQADFQKEATLTTPAPQPVKRRYEIPVLGEEKKEVAAEAPATPAAAPAEAPAPKADSQNTEDQATSATPEGEEPESKEKVTPEQAAKREGRRFERKLDKAYRLRAEAQARADILERQLAEARAQAAPKAPESEPRLEQFDYDPEKYAAAKADYAKAQAAKEIEGRQRTESAKQAQAALLSSWEEKADRGLEKYPDWQEKVGDLQPVNALISAIMEAENGDDIAYHLAKNPKEAERIANLSPVSQVREIGKLEAKLASEPVKPKAPSKAPAPITPLTGVATVASPEPSENDDMRDWMRKRQKQVHGKRV